MGERRRGQVRESMYAQVARKDDMLEALGTHCCWNPGTVKGYARMSCVEEWESSSEGFLHKEWEAEEGCS